VSLRVQARDRSGNAFARQDFEDHEAAIREASRWISDYPGLVVEILGPPTLDTFWICGDCKVRNHDMLAEECQLCGAGRLL